MLRPCGPEVTQHGRRDSDVASISLPGRCCVYMDSIQALNNIQYSFHAAGELEKMKTTKHLPGSVQWTFLWLLCPQYGKAVTLWDNLKYPFLWKYFIKCEILYIYLHITLSIPLTTVGSV